MDIQDTLIIRGHEEIKFFLYQTSGELQKYIKNTLFFTLLTVKKSVHSNKYYGR